MAYSVSFALAAICPLPAASCCGPTLDVARYAFEPAHSNLLAGSGHLATNSNDIFGFNRMTDCQNVEPTSAKVLGRSVRKLGRKAQSFEG